MTEPVKVPGFSDPAVRNYSFLCLCGLLALLLGLMQRGLGMWSLFPVLIGLLTLVVRWRVGPLVVLVALGTLLFVPTMLRLGRTIPLVRPQLADLVICLGILGYIAGHYRLQTFVSDIFPREGRAPAAHRKGQRGPAALRGQPRSSILATAGELVLLLASLPMWVGLALVIYPRLLPRREDGLVPGDEMHLGFSENIMSDLAYRTFGSTILELTVGSVGEIAEAAWRCRLLVLASGAVILSVWGVVRYLAWLHWTPDEAKLVVQDAAWKETCGEQRRINTWRMWARQRRKGGAG